MNLLAQQDLIREHWTGLLCAAEEVRLTDHALLGILGAALARLLAEQPENVSSVWITDLNAHVKELRRRSTLDEV